jgi:hypothetical protein
MNTGWAPTRMTTLALAANVIAGTITSCPGPMPQACSATSSAPVADVKVRTMRPPRYADKACSNSWTFGPLVIQPERRTSATAAMVSSSMVGFANGK